jgi:GNAT superfamily N-acetyltransferase
VEPLTEGRFADLAALFEEGGDPKWCWCMYFHKRGLSWSNSTAAGNRADLAELARHEPSPGLVCYHGERVVGWVSIAPREAYDRLSTAKLLAPVDERPVWSIVCFVVSREARGAGVGHVLLAAAVEYARSRGALTIEGYPVADERGRVPAASAFQGTQSMFEKAGFEVVETRRWNAASPPRPIMRLELAAPAQEPESAR